jgi:hypothetical protein
MAGSKNEFLKKRDARDRAFYEAGMMMGCQLVHDFVQMALRDQETMGKDTFGRARIEKLFNKCKEYDDYYSLCFTDHKDADKRQEEMDAVLKELWGKDLCPFAERYPYAKQFGYDKPLKGWVE